MRKENRDKEDETSQMSICTTRFDFKSGIIAVSRPVKRAPAPKKKITSPGMRNSDPISRKPNKIQI